MKEEVVYERATEVAPKIEAWYVFEQIRHALGAAMWMLERAADLKLLRPARYSEALKPLSRAVGRIDEAVEMIEEAYAENRTIDGSEQEWPLGYRQSFATLERVESAGGRLVLTVRRDKSDKLHREETDFVLEFKDGIWPRALVGEVRQYERKSWRGRWKLVKTFDGGTDLSERRRRDVLSAAQSFMARHLTFARAFGKRQRKATKRKTDFGEFVMPERVH